MQLLQIRLLSIIDNEKKAGSHNSIDFMVARTENECHVWSI